MSSSPVLVLDIDGVVSLAQPGSAAPWYASLQADWGFDHDEMARDFFRRDFLEVLRGRLDLYVALHGWLETKGMADRLDEFVAYWFAKDAVIDREVLALADAWRQRTGGRCFTASNQEHHRIAYLRDEAGLGRAFRRDHLFGRPRRLQTRPRVLHQRPGAHGRDGGAVDPVRRRCRGQCRRRPRLRLAGDALSRPREPEGARWRAGVKAPLSSRA